MLVPHIQTHVHTHTRPSGRYGLGFLAKWYDSTSAVSTSDEGQFVSRACVGCTSTEIKALREGKRNREREIQRETERERGGRKRRESFSLQLPVRSFVRQIAMLRT